MAAKNKPNEIYITRIYDAPVKMVWDAWTDPKQVAKWWGPRGFTITTHSKDLRVGGHWAYTMHGPDGTNYENKTIYHEVVEQSRLVYDHGGNDDRPPLFRVTVEFHDLKGRTKMEMTMALATAEAAQQTKGFIKVANGNSTWDRLAEYLAQEGGLEDQFVINRSFEAPIETMFQMWTDPAHLSKWLPPTGFTMKFLRAEIKPGGTSFYSMSNGQGVTMYGRAHYLEISPFRRMVYTQEFTDQNEKQSRHPLAPTWPAMMKTIVAFEAEDTRLTRVTITWSVHGEATPEERQTFHQSKSGMTQGWTGSFDKLEEHLAAMV